MKQLKLLFVSLLIYGISFAQNYGNEWIDFNQDYFEFTVAETGVYRISQEQLSSAGANISSVDPRNFQIFINGEQQPVYVFGESDGIFDPGDYIEVLIQQNDGSFDSQLYVDRKQQPHAYTSLYTDSTTCFITWTAGNPGERLTDYYDNNYTGAEDTFFIHESVLTYLTEWWDGQPSKPLLYLSEYSHYEGFGRPIDQWRPRFTPTVKLDGITQLYAPVNLEVSFSTTNDPQNYNGNGNNHEILLEMFKYVAPDRGYYEVARKEGSGYFHDTFKIQVAPDFVDLGGDRIRVGFGTIGPGPTIGAQKIEYLKATYPHGMDLQNSSQLLYTKRNSRYQKFTKYTSGKNQPYILDWTNKVRIRGDVASQVLQFNTPSNGAYELYIYDNQDVISVQSSMLSRTLSDPVVNRSVKFDYLIITNKKLRESAQEYAAYRNSVAGGKHISVIAYVDDLMDEYSYGMYHPTSIRNFLKQLKDEGTHNNMVVLLLGKGQTYTNIRLNSIVRENLDLVPAIGNSPSDYLFVSPLDLSSLEIWFPIARIPAKTNNEVRHYLEKVKEFETDPKGIWRKNKLDLAGGHDDVENQSFKNALKVYSNTFAGEFVGGNTTLLSKNQPLYIDPSITAAIQRNINSGVSVVNYFGHGSPSYLEIEIGEASKLKNTGKYPMYYFNGCSVGNTFNESSIAEEYLFEEGKGAIVWAASTNSGVTSYLHSHAKEFSNVFYRDLYGKSIGEVIKETTKRYQSVGDYQNIKQVRQMLFYGDPSLIFFNVKEPDYTSTENDIIIQPVFNEVDTFAIDITVYNYGKTSNDTLDIQIVQTFPDNTTKNHGIKRTGAVYNKENFRIWLKTSDRKAGLNTFTFTLDPQNKINEFSPNGESNNVISAKAVFRDNSFTIISPRENSISGTNRIELMIQQNKYFADPADYIFELDTNPTFSSPLLQSKQVNGQFIIAVEMDIPPIDSTDFFWRVKKTDDPEWKTGTFAYIFKAPVGWSQGYKDKFIPIEKEYLTYNDHKWEFAKLVSSNYQVWSHGGAGPLPRTMLIDGVSAWFDWSKWNGVQILAVNPINEKRFSYSSQYNKLAKEVWYPEYANRQYYVLGTYSGFYQFNTTLPEVQDSFLKHLQMIPDGYHIFLQNGINTGIETWDSSIFKELEKFGVVYLDRVLEKEPFSIIGQKGIAPGDAIEKYGDSTNPTTPLINQEVILTNSLYPPSKKGNVRTPDVGPAVKWSSFVLDKEGEDSPLDSFYVRIYGYQNGQTPVLLAETDKKSTDLSFIDATVYPTLFAKIYLFDPDNRTPLKIKRWTFHYDGLPEGTIFPEGAYTWDKAKLQEGDTFRFEVAFKNILNQNFDSILVNYRVNNENLGVVLDTTFLTSDLKPDEQLTVAQSIYTDGLTGKNSVILSFNPNFAQAEYELINNVTEESFEVVKDSRNPQLDVVIDGMHIADGDIVSPDPEIVMSAWDENPYYLLDKSEYFEIKLRKPGKTEHEIIDLSNPAVIFEPATAENNKAKLIYNPQDLADGLYELNISVTDRSENLSSDDGYIIRFNVVNKSTITRVYPYPNPMTTNTRFVFTLTGRELPDYFKIQIMNVSGRVVKEITQDELGPLRIGNNISQFAWNGTDEFGDKLANGVYFYRVKAMVNGKDIELKEMQTGNLFKNDVGKLYIAR